MRPLVEPGAADSNIRIGLAGLDNTRIVAFAGHLHDPESNNRVTGATFAAAWPGRPSPDFAMSAARYDRFLGELRDRYRVPMLDSLDEVAEKVDAWMLEAVDGRGREELFGRLLAYGKPIFVDKPFALSAASARRMMKLAERAAVPFMSCSALRYSERLSMTLQDTKLGRIEGADLHGPMELEPTQPGYFWYGIHMAEMLFRTLGTGCLAITAKRTAQADTAFAEWDDGRIGTIRGFRTGRESFGGQLHRERGTCAIDDLSAGKPYLATMLEEIVHFFRTGISPIDPAETLAIIRFLEAANESADGGNRVLF